MSNKDKILKLIVEEGEKEAQEILKEGELEKERILKEARDNAEIKRSEIEKDMKDEIDAINKRGESQLGIESRNIALRKKRTLISEIFKDIEDKLIALTSEEKIKWYLDVFNKYYSDGSAEIILNEAEKSSIGKDFIDKINNQKVVLSDSICSFKGGFIISEEKTEINCTIDVLIEEEKKKYESEVAKLLFGKDSIWSIEI